MEQREKKYTLKIYDTSLMDLYVKMDEFGRLDDGLSKVRFADVNLYDNELDETLALVAYTGYSSSQKHKIGLSTEWTTDGQFAKAWRRMEGKLYLFKAGSDGFANARKGELADVKTPSVFCSA